MATMVHTLAKRYHIHLINRKIITLHYQMEGFQHSFAECDCKQVGAITSLETGTSIIRQMEQALTPTGEHHTNGSIDTNIVKWSIHERGQVFQHQNGTSIDTNGKSIDTNGISIDTPTGQYSYEWYKY